MINRLTQSYIRWSFSCDGKNQYPAGDFVEGLNCQFWQWEIYTYPPIVEIEAENKLKNKLILCPPMY